MNGLLFCIELQEYGGVWFMLCCVWSRRVSAVVSSRGGQVGAAAGAAGGAVAAGEIKKAALRGCL